MKLFGRFACLYIGGPVTGMHGRPAASGGRPLPQQGGAAVTGLRAVWGARTPAPAEETAAHAVKQTARYPRAKPKERIRQKWEDILCETACTSFRNMLYYLHQKSACGGAARRTGEPVPAAAGREPAAGQTKQFIFPYVQHHLPIPRAGGGPKNRRPRTVSPFSICRAPGPGRPGAIPAPARTPAAKGGDAYDCPQMKKLLQIVSAHSHRLMAMLTRRSNCSLAEAYQ